MNLPNYIDARKRTKDKFKIFYDDYNIPDNIINSFKDKTYYIETYGCQMNVHDSENISAILEDLGFKKIDNMDNADLILLNTCAIRENAHNKVFGMLGRVKHLKETKKDIITCFCGCMAQEENVANELKNKYKWVDIIFGTHNIHKLPIYLKNLITERKQNLEVFSCEGNIFENIPVKRESLYKAWVNIMLGCDKFCTYCIVPYTRGKQRSRKYEDIIDEIMELVNNGYKEITLLGQNVNAYGKDLYDNYNMANLLEDVAKTGIDRVRFVTSHPWDFNDDMIDVIKHYNNIMPYIHLPIQSGSSKILKLMNRSYTKEEYISLYNKIKKEIPNCSITTDIIVGFPNETKEDFQETIDIYNNLEFDLAYTFIFSKREGTPACKLPDNISIEEKENRLQQLNQVVNKYANKKNQMYINQIVDVLIEDHSDKKGYLKGYTETMKLVNVKADQKYLGQIIKVKIIDAKTWSLDGEIYNG